MDLIKGVYYEDIKKPDIKNTIKKNTSIQKEEKKDTVISGMNFDICKDISVPLDVQEVQPKQKSTTQRNTKKAASTGVVPADNKSGYSATEPYMNQYQETNSILKSAIIQIDMQLQDMQDDLSMLRHNRTLRNKYQQMSLIQGNMGNYIGNKIAAAKELNNTISKCNDLELRRAKELKDLDNQDDDKRIMDLYNAMISMPIGGQAGMMNSGFATPLGPNTFEMTYAGNPHAPTPGVITSVDGGDDIGYQNYLNNKTSAQNMMSLDTNPNIQQVVVHNRSTGQSYFEIMDMNTMQPVPNTEKYDNSFLEDTHMDFINNVATNVNLGESYPIIQVGGDPILNEY